MTLPRLDYQKLSDHDYRRFRDLILEQSGLYFSEQKRLDLSIGITKALVESSLVTSKPEYDLNQYYNLLKNRHSTVGQAEMKRLINLLTIGETYFFRDEAQFDALAYQVLPQLIQQKRDKAAQQMPYKPLQLRIWSAGCASGEEPYSIAMLLKEILPDLNQWQIFILGTDINDNVLKRATTAIYSNWSFREERARRLRSRYFDHNPPARFYHLHDEIKEMVTFTRLNLMEAVYPEIHTHTSELDLIVCRNVTIYFKQKTTQQIIDRFYKALAPQGWLMVGHAEASLTTYRAFQAQSFPGAILYQKVDKPKEAVSGWQPASANKLTSAKTSPAPSVSPKSATLTPAPVPSKTPVTSTNSPLDQAYALLEDGYVNQAIVLLKQVITTNPQAKAYTLLGRAYADAGRFNEAKQACEEALSLNKLQAEAYLTLATIYQTENKVSLAKGNLKKAIFLDHTAPVPYFNLAILYKKENQVDQAKRNLQIVVKILEKWPSDKIIPDTGGKTVQSLLKVTHQLLASW